MNIFRKFLLSTAILSSIATTSAFAEQVNNMGGTKMVLNQIEPMVDTITQVVVNNYQRNGAAGTSSATTLLTTGTHKFLNTAVGGPASVLFTLNSDSAVPSDIRGGKVAFLLEDEEDTYTVSNLICITNMSPKTYSGEPAPLENSLAKISNVMSNSVFFGECYYVSDVDTAVANYDSAKLTAQGVTP